MKQLFVAWTPFIRRPESMQQFFGYRLHFIKTDFGKKRLKPFEYAVKAAQTLALLIRSKPDVLWVQVAPTILLYVAFLYKWLFRPKMTIIADCHNSMYRRPWIKMPGAVALLNRCDRVLVHNSKVLENALSLGVDGKKLSVLETKPADLLAGAEDPPSDGPEPHFGQEEAGTVAREGREPATDEMKIGEPGAGMPDAEETATGQPEADESDAGEAAAGEPVPGDAESGEPTTGEPDAEEQGAPAPGAGEAGREFSAQAAQAGDAAAAAVNPENSPAAAAEAGSGEDKRPWVLLPCSFDKDEPIDVIVAAARLIPHIRIVITGNPAKYSGPQDLNRLPENVELTGFLPKAEYDGLLRSCDLVMGVTTRDDVQLSVANEAVGAGKPMVISGSALQRELFYSGAVYVDPLDPRSIAEGCLTALERIDELKAGVARLRRERNERWLRQANALRHFRSPAVSG